jgi:hypothetical protein
VHAVEQVAVGQRRQAKQPFDAAPVGAGYDDEVVRQRGADHRQHLLLQPPPGRVVVMDGFVHDLREDGRRIVRGEARRHAAPEIEQRPPLLRPAFRAPGLGMGVHHDGEAGIADAPDRLQHHGQPLRLQRAVGLQQHLRLDAEADEGEAGPAHRRQRRIGHVGAQRRRGGIGREAEPVGDVEPRRSARAAAPRRAARAPARRASRPRGARGAASGGRKLHDEARAEDPAVQVAPVLRADPPAQRLHDLAGDGEAEAGMLAEALAARAFE